MNRFDIHPLSLAGLQLVERHPIGDDRGFLARLFCADEMKLAGWTCPIAQINHTYTSKRGTVRGMHFQHHPRAELKLINCLRGEIFDVAVDLRKGSPTFLHWHGEVLTAANNKGLLIPTGFAHGFQTLSDEVELIYLHSVAYSPAAEAGLNARDPAVGIRWPLEVSEMSLRDKALPLYSDNFACIEPL